MNCTALMNNVFLRWWHCNRRKFYQRNKSRVSKITDRSMYFYGSDKNEFIRVAKYFVGEIRTRIINQWELDHFLWSKFTIIRITVNTTESCVWHFFFTFCIVLTIFIPSTFVYILIRDSPTHLICTRNVTPYPPDEHRIKLIPLLFVKIYPVFQTSHIEIPKFISIRLRQAKCDYIQHCV